MIYIGKAVCFKHRFWNLIETWQKEDSKRDKRNHDSFNTWEKNKLQDTLPATDLLFRYTPISHEKWDPKKKYCKDDVKKALRETLSKETCNPIYEQEGRSAVDITSGAAFAEENGLLRKYKRCLFGSHMRTMLSSA